VCRALCRGERSRPFEGLIGCCGRALAILRLLLEHPVLHGLSPGLKEGLCNLAMCRYTRCGPRAVLARLIEEIRVHGVIQLSAGAQ
jgi:hypothetical protein